MTKTVRTTAIEVTKPDAFDLLAKQFFLVRYAVPSRISGGKRSNEFGHFHNRIKEQINVPYYVFTYDQGGTPWAVYALYPRSENQPTQVLSSVVIDDEALDSRLVEFDQIPLHLLLKVLQIHYCRVQSSEYPKFVGQNRCYVHARRKGSKNHICLEIELKGDIANKESNQTQLFRIKDSACLFTPVKQESIKQGYHYREAYFARNIQGDSVFFLQIKPSEAEQYKAALYERRTFDGQKTTLNYHDNSDIEHARGYIIHIFLRDYKAYLEQYGFTVQIVERTLDQHFPTDATHAQKLPLPDLGTIWVFDNRLNRTQHPIENYLALMEQTISGIEFRPLTDLTDDFDGAVLILQDCEGIAFEKDMPLYGGPHDDPYQKLYTQVPHVVKQSLNVNSNNPDETKGDAYLQYPFVPPDEGFNKLHVTLNELFLKYLVVRQHKVQACLPFTAGTMIFARRDGHNETAMLLNSGELSFFDLKDPTQRERYYEVLESWNVIEAYEALMDRKEPKDKQRKNSRPADYRLVIQQDCVVEIEDIDESILYEYDQIVERADELSTPLPIDQLKLWPRYDQIKTQAMLDHEKLILHGLAPKRGMPFRKPKTNAEKESMKLLDQLKQYDDILDEVELEQTQISFVDLTTHRRWMPKIATIFGVEPEEDGSYKSGFLKDYYQRIDMFSSTKGKDVIPTYQGIWYDDHGWYVVGDVNPFKFSQARAHLFRRFTVHYGNSFYLTQMLDAMSVKWVRYNQYTVYPYYFHLIDILDDHNRSAKIPIQESPDQ